MLFKKRGAIKPYGWDWNSDRSAPDYDPQRDPWIPGSPVYGQYPRRPWIREGLKEPIWWAILGWFTVSFGLILLSVFDLISSDTFFIGWMGKYLLALTGFVIWGLWSAVGWFRRTPSAERGPAFRGALKRLPGNLAW